LVNIVSIVGAEMKVVRYVNMNERHPTGIGTQISQFLQRMETYVTIKKHTLNHIEIMLKGKPRLGYLSMLANKLIPVKKSKNEILHAGDISLTPYISDTFDIIEIWDTMPFEQFNVYQKDYISALNIATYIPKTLKVDILVTHSEETKRNVQRLFGDKEIKVIPAGIDTDFFMPHETIEKEYRSVLAVAAYYPQKNLSSLIEGCGYASQKEPLTLRLVGRQRGFQKSLDDYPNMKVEYLGYVSKEQLLIEYNRASIYCSASLKEGFGVTPLEAMACGTLPVLSNIPTHMETVKGNGIYFDATDVVSIGKSINMALRFPGYSEDSGIREHLHKAAMEYSWTRVISKWLELYESLGVFP